MAVPYILARTMKEAHSFAREELGLAYGQYRIVNSPSTIKSIRGVDLYLVPGYKKRFDRFAIAGAIRWTRMNVIDVEKQQVEEPDAPFDFVEDAPENPPAFIVVAVPDDTPIPEYHSQIVGAVLPDKTPEEPDAVADDLVPEGEQLAFPVDVSNGDNMIAEGSPDVTYVEDFEALAPAKEPKKRRRSRCKTCGTLHYKGDPCPTEE